jgi:acetolactate synthase-1/2/3 large subunit
MDEDAIVVIEMGAAICGAFQVMRVRPPQRLLTSGGLGEMGCGLPYAIGAWFATGRQVIALLTDGGTMLNLQELQTIAHHNIPIKMVLFDNGGYGMIKHTQKNLRYAYAGVDGPSGVSTPNWRRLLPKFGIQTHEVSSPEFWGESLDRLMNTAGPVAAVVHIDPEQRYWPKLEPIRGEDGTLRSPRFDELTP